MCHWEDFMWMRRKTSQEYIDHCKAWLFDLSKWRRSGLVRDQSFVCSHSMMRKTSLNSHSSLFSLMEKEVLELSSKWIIKYTLEKITQSSLKIATRLRTPDTLCSSTRVKRVMEMYLWVGTCKRIERKLISFLEVMIHLLDMLTVWAQR